MAQIETLGIVQDIESLVSDQLQVVSYKWLSRNYSVSSNTSKRLLGLEAVYVLSGWLKSDPSSYNVRHVSGRKLAEAKEEFDDNCCVEVYSVQACIPKDPSALWNAEFVQAEELFKQPPSIENSLRDCRFCGISNPFVRRNVEGTPLSTGAPQVKTEGVAGFSGSSSSRQNVALPKHVHYKQQQSSPKISLQAPSLLNDVKSESIGTRVFDQASKPPGDREKAAPVAENKKKVQNGKGLSTSGGSLANLWGRASAKSKSDAPAENDNCIPAHAEAGSEAQIYARETVAGVSSDDDGQEVSFKRGSNGEGTRKRRVVLDFSDDEVEDAVNLASPDNPKGQSCQDPKESSKVLIPERTNLNFEEQVEDQPKVEEEISVDVDSNQPLGGDSSVVSIEKKAGIFLKEKTYIPEKAANKMEKPANATSCPPKRRKVLTTVIDERGREVTEVIWEGEETEAKKSDRSIPKEADSKVASAVNTAASAVNTAASAVNTAASAISKPTSAINSPPAAKKSMGNTAPTNLSGKAGSKKVVNKDPKQGNILSFFKKV